MNNRVKPSTLPGFMELLPAEQLLFNDLLDTIRENYEKFGFLPIDTPVLEKSEVLLAKGGGETEKQVYRFQKGDTDISMRFDLTVPLARYVAEHYNDLEFPFRRYHIGKVYRGERNQRGRFREFYQCDIDIIGNGTLSLYNDAEIPAVIYSTFKDLNIGDFIIRMNHRKLLNGYFQHLKISDFPSTLRILDKLDKIGWNKVETELEEAGLSIEVTQEIYKFVFLSGSVEEKLKALDSWNITDSLFQEGLQELKVIFSAMEAYGVPKENYTLDLTIARGLDYYTGIVYETFLKDYPDIGSICSGGRYENLAQYYTKQALPGVGISIGLSRLFFQLIDGNILTAKEKSPYEVLIIPMKGCEEASIKILQSLRESGVSSTIYSESGKMGKKFKYADALHVPYVIVIGEDELEKGEYSLRNMKTGEQEMLSLEKIKDCFLKETDV
ncbi:MAG: histidine--tRNA ligase [Tissierellia bacterium]|nr:histidine--tRNA ligase [Tissierellia bacterium]